GDEVLTKENFSSSKSNVDFHELSSFLEVACFPEANAGDASPPSEDNNRTSNRKEGMG
ncbi:unnamed protein product, partial [Brassica oleracea var. botrytis]